MTMTQAHTPADIQCLLSFIFRRFGQPGDAGELTDEVVASVRRLEVYLAQTQQPSGQTQPLRRAIERWRGSEPDAMSRQSQAAICYAIEDARSDILTLAAGRPEAPFTDDSFIEGYKVGTKFCPTVAEANKAIERGDGAHWIPLYRKKHPAMQQPSGWLPIAKIGDSDAQQD